MLPNDDDGATATADAPNDDPEFGPEGAFGPTEAETEDAEGRAAFDMREDELEQGQSPAPPARGQQQMPGFVHDWGSYQGKRVRKVTMGFAGHEISAGEAPEVAPTMELGEDVTLAITGRWHSQKATEVSEGNEVDVVWGFIVDRIGLTEGQPLSAIEMRDTLTAAATALRLAALEGAGSEVIAVRNLTDLAALLEVPLPDEPDA